MRHRGGEISRPIWRLPLLAALCLLAGLAPATAQNTGYVGVASCAGSTCHGRAEGNGEVVRQDEIATWQEPSRRPATACCSARMGRLSP